MQDEWVGASVVCLVLRDPEGFTKNLGYSLRQYIEIDLKINI